MNNTARLTVLLTMAFFAVTACAGSAKEQSESGNVPGRQGGRALEIKETYTFSSDVAGIDWVLTEVRVNGVKTGFDRSKLADEAFANFFTLRFEGELVRGVAAPNSYRGPYTPGENNAIAIGNMASTQMAALFEPEGLKEHEYYAVLQNVNRWKIAGNYLELYSTGEDGKETALVYFAAE